MRIICETETAFYDSIASLVARGLGFVANADLLTIELTGAH